MANRRFDRPYTIGVRRIWIAGSFATNGSSNPVAANVRGLGFGYAPVNGAMAAYTTSRGTLTSSAGIVHTATGKYTMTLDDSYQDFDSIQATMQANSDPSGSHFYQTGTGTTANFDSATSAPTIVFYVYDVVALALVDLAAATNNRVHFAMQLRDSTERYGTP